MTETPEQAQAGVADALLGAAAFFGTLSAAASFRLSVRLLEKANPRAPPPRPALPSAPAAVKPASNTANRVFSAPQATTTSVGDGQRST